MRLQGTRLLVWGGLVLLFFLASLALRWGLADIYAFDARSRFQSRLGPKAGPAEADWQAAEQSLRRALALEPDHPDHLDLMARLLELRAMNDGMGKEERVEARQQALADYRQAVALRPAWPYSWAGLMQAKLMAGEIDGEMRRALRQAVELGPWEPAVQLMVAEAGFSAWKHLDAGLRRQVIDNAVRGMQRQPRNMIQSAGRHGKLAVLCAWLSQDAYLVYCRGKP